MELEDFRFVSTLQGSARRFKDKANAAYSILFPIVQGELNMKMMLSLQVNSNFDSALNSA